MKNFKRVCNKTYYNLLLRTQNVQNRVNKWHICLNTSLTLEDWEDVFIRAFKSSINSKSRNFQYKILNRILATNSFLKMCNITNSSLCKFCKVDEEAVEDLFWYCTVIREFWDDIYTCLWPYIDLSMFLNCENTILGVTNTTQKALIKHLFITLNVYFCPKV